MLDSTPRHEVSERSALRVNPIKTCQPVGALYAALGVHGCMPHSHGSQGCVSFHRMFLTRHFKDPVMASTSAFTEGSSVFGGGANLTQAVRNLFDVYDPKLIAIHTTCLSETIGDDLGAIVSAMDIPDGKRVIYCNTPSYVGSHVTGYANMLAGLVRHLAEKPSVSGPMSQKLALFAGFVNPGDMREIKRLVEEFDINYTLLPDVSGVLDAPLTGSFKLYPDGGTPIEAIEAMGLSRMGLALGEAAAGPGAAMLRQQCGVPDKTLPLPMGVRLTDRFMMELSDFALADVPECLEEERGQLIDVLVDAHPYLDGRSCAIFGDPDTILGLASATLEMGMLPRYVFTTSPCPQIIRQIEGLFEEAGLASDCLARDNADFFELHQRIIAKPVDVLIGSSFGKQIARAENIPLVRVGFPVLDRYVHSYMTMLGYRGAMRLVELISNALMDKADRECAEEDFEMVM
jgi:nitrogenase molybdenum-iron protein beta chain